VVIKRGEAMKQMPRIAAVALVGGVALAVVAGFENADSLGDYSGRDLKTFGKQNWVRWGVTKGLAYERSLGVNPFHYRFIGGTDSHNGTPSNVDEDNFAAGSHGAGDGPGASLELAHLVHAGDVVGTTALV
jgi:hypothetical protein